MKIISLLLLYQLLKCFRAFDHCTTPVNEYRLFGTKTLYRDVRNKQLTVSEITKPGCFPIFVYMIARHGARYPGTKALPYLKDLKELLSEANSTGKAKLCQKDMEELSKWAVWTDIYDDKNLTQHGSQELKELASRYKQLFPYLLNDTIPASHYRFKSTNTQRTKNSMHAFASSLFNESIQVNESNDLVTLNRCSKYEQEVKNHPNISLEYDKFMKGPIIAKIARRVGQRLGVRLNRVTAAVLNIIYVWGCRAQSWTEARYGPWCRLFTGKELREYAKDLEYYPTNSYKFPITYQQNCELSKEIVGDTFYTAVSDRRNEKSVVKAHFRFAHRRNIITLATNLRLYKRQDELKANDWRMNRHRSFRTSKMAPSASNLVFVLNKCIFRTWDRPNLVRSKYTVQTFWNEKLLVKFPACLSARKGNQGMCDLNTWLETYQEFVPNFKNACNQDEICS